MSIQLAHRAIRLYSNKLVPLHTNKHNRRAWLRSIDFLEDRWLLAVPMTKEQLT